MKLIPLAAIAVGALTVLSGGTVAAFALVAQPDITVIATVKHHPDNGHGTPALWADDSFVRTMVIHQTGAKAFTITMTDKGTFTTRKGSGSPSGAKGKQISRTLTGAFAGIGVGHVTGALVANPASLSGKVYDDTAQGGTPFPRGGAWAKIFFTQGATVEPFDHYTFTYTTADEKWVDSDTNNDGQAPTAGNITGKLSNRLALVKACQVSKTDRHTRWTIKSVQGDRAVGFTYKLSYRGKWSKPATAAVPAGGSTELTTATGGYLSVRYDNGYGVSLRTSARSQRSVYC